MSQALLLTALLLASAGPDGAAGAGPRLAVTRGDHVCIIGNALGELQQHDGWLEALVHSRFPQHELVFRNLSFAGDELDTRPRSKGFGDPDEHLRQQRADVVLAFFGYNESFAGPAGLPRFRANLASFIEHTRTQKYNGQSAPRLVLFSPVAHERLPDRGLPDGVENNARLRSYTRAMAEIARAHGVPFVDLFHPTLALYGASARPLTTNGIHLTDEGNRRLAHVIDEALFGPAARPDAVRVEALRAAVLDKNFHWFHRHRTTDGYSIYGERADIPYAEGQTNRVVMQREMDVLDTMTANRDRRVWALARGKDQAVDDANTPPFVTVKTNKPGPLDGRYAFLGGEEAIAKMTVAPGMKVELFASEERFPELVKPTQMAFDTRGRLWVAVWPSYPHWKPREEMNDKLLILEDTDGNGRADRSTVFADHLHNPTGFELWDGGVLVAMAPYLLFLKDTDGDGRADVRERMLLGLDSADTHHTANSFVFDPGGALYFQEGLFHRTQIETPWGPPVRLRDAGVFRFEPRTRKVEVYVAYDFANPHGHVFDRWGQDLVADGTRAQVFFAGALNGRVEFPRRHSKLAPIYRQRARPCPAIEILSSRHFPDENQGNLLVANVIGVQGILQYRPEDKGAGFAATEVTPIVHSSDPNFRPSDIEIGPDGAIYFLDWHNPIIGHLQHNLRDPARDRSRGRVYRVTYPGRPLVTPARISGAPIEDLLRLLEQPDDRLRYRAKIEIGARAKKPVMAAVDKWIAEIDAREGEHEHHLLEALWVRQWHDVVDQPLLRRLLRARDFRARAAAARVLRYWRDRVPGALAAFRVLARDAHPRVRLEAVTAASFFREPAAVDVALAALQADRDEVIEYALKESLADAAANPDKKLRQAAVRALASMPCHHADTSPQLATAIAPVPARTNANSTVIRSVPHMMLYDRRKITVEAGASVELVFENADIMPHNLVVTAPGAMAEVGLLAERMGAEGQAKDYVPDTPKVLWATKLVVPGQSQTLRFTAPQKLGDYPYVCTFPGHWLIMNGILEVVAKGAATGPVAATRQPPALPSRSFVKMWTLEDLEPELRGSAARSPAHGREMFTVAGCASCHTVNGEGGRIGPDLTEVAKRYRGRDLLRQILDPSSEIDERFRSYVIETKDGNFVTGAIASEDATTIHVRANPLEADAITALPKQNVASKQASETSAMPTGLLATLNKAEVLNLLAYLEAGGRLDGR